MLLRLMDSLKQAAGCAHQLAHAQQNPAWLDVRNALEATRAMAGAMAVKRAMPRQEVLEALKGRERLLGAVH